jgi:amino acid transporter
LRRNLGLIETVSLSLAGVAPTVAMAFNTSLAAQSSGRAAPLAFAIGALVLAVIGLSFIAFSRRIATAGSAYAFITYAFGPRTGFLVGWLLLFAYTLFGSAVAGLIGDFLNAAAHDFGISQAWLPKVLSIGGMLLACYLVFRNMKFAVRLMFTLEALSMLAILVLSVVILVHQPSLSLLPFVPAPDHGWSGVGYAVVFAVLSFAGFEAAATLGEESSKPRVYIPAALLGTIAAAGAFFVIASYAQVLGYGLGHADTLGNAAAPLNTLAEKYISRRYATLIDLAAAVSAFSAVLASTGAAARILFALGRAGLSRSIANGGTGTPASATLVVCAASLAGLVIWMPFIGGTAYYGDAGTVGTLAIILVYIGVAIAQAVVSMRSANWLWGLTGAAGAVLLLWPLYATLYPVPAYPANLWPYVVVAWVVLGCVTLAFRPELGRATLDEVP